MTMCYLENGNGNKNHYWFDKINMWQFKTIVASKKISYSLSQRNTMLMGRYYTFKKKILGMFYMPNTMLSGK